jgi:hypothetical protein
VITCTTHWLSLSLIVSFSAQEWVTVPADRVREFLISCGMDPDEDDPLDIEECPGYWADRPQVDRRVG